MNYIARMDFREGDPVTYNYVEELKIRKELIEEDERRVANEKIKISNEKREISNEIKKLELYEQGLEQDKQVLEQDKQKLVFEKISFAKALKEEGYSIRKILKITKLSEKIVTML